MVARGFEESGVGGSCRLIYAPFITAAETSNGFFTCSRARMFESCQSSQNRAPMLPHSDRYSHSDFGHIETKRAFHVRTLAVGEDGSMASVTRRDFPRNADAASQVSNPGVGGVDQAWEKAETRKLRLVQRLVASFKEAFDFVPEPPLYFYLKGAPFLEEPYNISTPDLGTVCLLNGVAFHIDEDLGRQVCIEDRSGLIAAVCAATSWAGGQANIPAITRWRRYRDDDKSIVQSMESHW